MPPHPLVSQRLHVNRSLNQSVAELYGFQFRVQGKGLFRNVGERWFCEHGSRGGVAQNTCLCCPCVFGPVATRAHALAAVPQIIRLFLTYMRYRRREGRHRSTVHSRLRSFAALYASKCWLTLCSSMSTKVKVWSVLLPTAEEVRRPRVGTRRGAYTGRRERGCFMLQI